VAAALRSTFDIYVELATHATLVLVLGIGQRTEPLARLAHDFAETVRQISRPGTASALTRAPSSLELGTSVSPRDAFLGRGEIVPVGHAEGRISSESIAGYPPGIPALLPGELITAEVIAYLKELTAAGARLHGAADPTFTTVRVLVEFPTEHAAPEQ
jgi:lysine decarboxylase